MNYDEFESEIKTKGFCYFRREDDTGWDSWVESVLKQKNEIFKNGLPEFDNVNWWDQSRNTKWLNKNNVEIFQKIPSDELCSLIDTWIEKYTLLKNENAQFATLLDGYPDRDCPSYANKAVYEEFYVSYMRGNLHVDGTKDLDENGGAQWTSALLVGVFLSEVKDEVGVGRPIYFPGSHIEFMKLVTEGKSKREAQSEVKKQFEYMRAYAHGKPGDVIIYHGAMLHGMEPNRSGKSRDMVYFRKHFQQNTNRWTAYRKLMSE